MSRAQRLLDLVQLLRRHRQPVSGAALADELGISLRTLYRDIASLQAQGAAIDGEPGLGYVLRAGFLLPPLMFSDEEIAALVLGSRWVGARADAPLALAARNAMAKIAAVLPGDLREELDTSPLMVGPGDVIETDSERLAAVRRAIRGERKLAIVYRGPDGGQTRRTIWPFALAYFDRVRMVAAWCELRQDFRHFRADRITALTPTDIRYPRRRLAMLKEWREREGISTP